MTQVIDAFRYGNAPKRLAKKISPGDRFGLLTAVRVIASSKQGHLWELLCDCGRSAIRPASRLTLSVKIGREMQCAECLRELRGGIEEARRQRQKEHWKALWEEDRRLYTDWDLDVLTADIRSAVQEEIGVWDDPVEMYDGPLTCSLWILQFNGAVRHAACEEERESENDDYEQVYRRVMDEKKAVERLFEARRVKDRLEKRRDNDDRFEARTPRLQRPVPVFVSDPPGEVTVEAVARAATVAVATVNGMKSDRVSRTPDVPAAHLPKHGASRS
jgi:hypothetical protein